MDSVQLLVGSGHRFEEVLDYPLPRLYALSSSVLRLQSNSRAKFVKDVAEAVGGVLANDKQLKQHIDSLLSV